MHPAEESILQVMGSDHTAPPREDAPLATSANEPTRWRRWLTRARSSTWLPIVGKTLAIGGFMLGFASIGAAATLMRQPGTLLASQLAPGASIAWLAPTPPPVHSPLPPASGAPTGTNSPGHTPAGESKPLRAEPTCDAHSSLCSNRSAKPDPVEGLTTDGKVILNVAPASVLTRLPGVGERRAAAIVQLRERLKRFRRPSDLLRVRGIGVRSLKRMLPHLVLDPPKPEPPSPEPPKPGEDSPRP